LLLLDPGHAVSGTAWIWLAYFALITLYLLQTHRYLFWRFVSVAPYFDALLPAKKDRESLTRILMTASRKSLQLVVSIGCAVIFLLFAWAAAPALAPRLSIGPASYLAVFIVIFLAAHGGYWIIVTVILLRALREKRSIAARRLDPLQTPALLELNKFYGAAGAFTTTVFPITEVPVIFALLLAHRTPAVVVVNVLAPLVALSFLLPIATLPRSYLTALVVREKRRTLEIIMTGHVDQEVCGGANLWERIRRLSLPSRMQIYSFTASMPETTYTRGSFAQLGLGIAAIVVPYVIQVIRYLKG
jgi:hypothetical protein